jgi:hypothetical protein
MGNIVPARSRNLDRRGGRIVNRTLDHIETQTDVGLARINQAAELQVGRVRAVVYVGKRAMQDVALLSQMEVQLSTLVPMATSRLQAIGDMVTLEATDVVADTVREVTR